MPTTEAANSVPIGALVSGPRGTILTAIPIGRDDQLRFLNALDDTCVVLVGTAGDTRVYRSLNGLARMGIGPRVRVYPCDAPPTVLATTAAVMRAGRFGAGDALEILRSLRAVTTTVAIVNTVSRLVSPAPSVRQHLRGLLPGATFVVDVPGRRVLGGHHALGRLKRVHGAALVLASSPDRQALLWRDELADLAPAAPRMVIERVGSQAVPWPTPVWAEVTGLAVTVEEFAARLRMYLARQPCPSCAAPVSGTICPMCGIVCEPVAPSPSRLLGGGSRPVETPPLPSGTGGRR